MSLFWIDFNGESMTPLLNHGDKILIQECSKNEIALGDVILYADKESKELILHRFIKLPFTTKGDRSLLFETNPEDLFLGKAILFQTKERHIYSFRWGMGFVFFSKLRTRHYIMRKLSLVGLIIFAKIHRVCSVVSIEDYNKMNLPIDP